MKAVWMLRFGRVVRDLRPLLVPVKRDNGHVQVQHIGILEQRFVCLEVFRFQEMEPPLLTATRERSAGTILGNCLAHAEEPGQDFFLAQFVDLGVTPVPAEHREQQRTQHIPGLGGVVAGIFQGSSGDKPVERLGCIQELCGINQGSAGGYRCRVVPWDFICLSSDLQGGRLGLRNVLGCGYNGYGCDWVVHGVMTLESQPFVIGRVFLRT
jgi:hypothetical protein